MQLGSKSGKFAEVAEPVDATDSKSVGLRAVGVRFPPSAPIKKKNLHFLAKFQPPHPSFLGSQSLAWFLLLYRVRKEAIMAQLSPAFLEVKYLCLLCGKNRWVEGCIVQEIGRSEGLPLSDLPWLKCPFCQGLSLPLGNIIGTTKGSLSMEDVLNLKGLRNLLQLQ